MRMLVCESCGLKLGLPHLRDLEGFVDARLVWGEVFERPDSTGKPRELKDSEDQDTSNHIHEANDDEGNYRNLDLHGMVHQLELYDHGFSFLRYYTPRMRTPCSVPGTSSMFLPWILLKKEPSDVYVGE